MSNLSMEEKVAIKNMEMFIKGCSMSCVSAREMQLVLDLYNREKIKNKELKNALIDMVNQFADTDIEQKYLYTMGLSALENAFSVLHIDDGIRREYLWKKLK